MTTDHELLAMIDERITELENGINLVESNGFLGTNRLFVQNSKMELSFIRALRAVVELHKPMTGGNYRSDTPQCSYCRSLCHSNSGLNCEDDGDGLWPCDTILRIEKELG